MNQRKVLSSCLLLWAYFFTAGAAPGTPVLMWSEGVKNGEQLNRMVPGEMSNEKLQKVLDEQLASQQNVDLLVLTSDFLTLEDFSVYGHEFPYVQSRVEGNQWSVSAEGVRDPLSTLSDMMMAPGRGQVFRVPSKEDVEALKLDSGVTHSAIVDLHGLSRSQIDGRVKSVVSSWRAQSKNAVVVVLAAKGNAAALSQQDELGDMQGRRLLSTSDNAVFANYSGCIFFYAKEIKVQILRTNHTVVTNYTRTLDNNTVVSGTCNNENATLNFDWGNTDFDGVKNVKLEMMFTTVSRERRWKLVGTNLTYEENHMTAATTLGLQALGIQAPYGFSYHCTPVTNFTLVNVSLADSATVTFRELQVQPFGIRNDKWSNADDCVGFFTIAIWMGIFPALIIGFILFYGLYMIADIKVMDRFDDPRGKTIQVNIVD